MKKCAHEMCGCEVAEGDEFCSDFCRQPTEGGRDMEMGDDCGCGHDACKKVAM